MSALGSEQATICPLGDQSKRQYVRFSITAGHNMSNLGYRTGHHMSVFRDQSRPQLVSFIITTGPMIVKII